MEEGERMVGCEVYGVGLGLLLKLLQKASQIFKPVQVFLHADIRLHQPSSNTHLTLIFKTLIV